MEDNSIRSKHILLVVDDEEDTAISMKNILERAGYGADWATDGGQAIAKAKEKSYDLVFLDIHLPGMSGVDIFREFKKLNPQLKVCVMTGWPQGVSKHMGDWLSMVKEGAIDKMLRKPFKKEEILQVVEEILGV